MSNSKIEYVKQLLSEYKEDKRMIALLNYELMHPARVSPSELIEAMNFAKVQSEGHASGGISNKTMYIALNYQETADELNRETVDDIAVKLFELEQKNARLEYYVSLLDRRQAAVLRMIYFEDYTWDEVAQKLDVALRTAHNIRKQALERLAEFYGFTSSIR